MATRNYIWRTASSGTEGTTTVYVDSFIGNDEQGLGTRTSPYKTLTKAWEAKETRPTTIVCRGLFSEQMTYGNHSCTIKGDYYGAATFDGQDKYLIYGYSISNLIILNASSDGSVPVWIGNIRFRGVGRANPAYVGSAGNAFGLASSPAFVGKSGLYWGIIGGSSAKNIIYWKPIVIDGCYKLSIGAQIENPCLKNCTIYDAGLDLEGNPSFIKKSPCSGGYYKIQSTIFSKTAIILNTTIKLDYTDCLFTSDCKYYYFSGDDSTSSYTEITLDGISKENRGLYLIERLLQIYSENNSSTSLQPKFTNCIFSDQTSEEIFNNPEKGDMTLIPGCDADLMDQKSYIGALPPAKNIPILDDSTGIAEAWDERSVSGCIVVENNKIWINPDSDSNVGSILSKIITINPREIQLNSIYSLMSSKWGNGFILGNNEPTGGINPIFNPTELTSGSGIIPKGLYLVKSGTVTLDDLVYNPGESFTISTDNFSLSENDGTIVEVLDPNSGDVLFCRCRSMIYKIINSGDSLTKGATYLNISGQPSEYHGRLISNGESFVCMVDGELASTKLGVIFDDPSVPSSEWVPARFWGEYFVSKENGSIKYDEYGIPYSSANYRTYSKGSLYKSVLDRKYIQFKIEVTKI